MGAKFDRMMNEVGEKLNFARNSLMGPNESIRDGQGFTFTANRIFTSIENFLDMSSSRYTPISEAIARGMAQASNSRNFSASDLASVRDVDVADIAIASTVASHGLTYIAMERAMDSVAQQITFQGLRATNSAAGFTAGDKVVDPRSAISPVVDFSRNGAKLTEDVTMTGLDSAGKTATVDFQVPVVIGETEILWQETSGSGSFELLAFDTGKVEPDNAGNVPMVMKKGGVIATASVNIHTGVVSITAAADLTAGALKVVACVDRIAETSGAHTLKLKPYMESSELVSTENRVILQTSVETQAQMNKILRKNAQYGVNVDFGKRAIDQVIMLYTYFIDLNIVRTLWEGISHTPELTLDLSGYATANYTSFAATKNDRINQFVEALRARFVSKTGSPITALIVDEKAGLMLASDSENFRPEDLIYTRRDGLIGFYRNIPVVRNVYLNDKGSIPGGGTIHNGVVIGVFKSPNGMCGPVAQGDYLPPYSTLPAVNANNPGDLSQALFSQTACKCVVPDWAILGEIQPFGV